MLLIIGIGCRSTDSLTEETPEILPEVAVNDTGIDSTTAQDSLKNLEQLRLDLVENHKNQLTEEYGAKANGISTFYITAQQFFYNGNYEYALYYIDKALNIRENADILALKGSIYLGLGSNEGFIRNWRKALELDRNVPIPNSDLIIAELQRQGLINENLERNF